MKVSTNWLVKFYRELLILFLARYYRDLGDMPIANFTKCLSGDISHISKNKYFSEKKARLFWEVLFDQHLKAHGLPESYVEYMKKMTKALALYSEAYNGKKWQIVKARVCEAEAEALMNVEGERIDTTCARISKRLGFPVRSNECSVVEFYSYLDIMSDI